ncbi:MAG: hypothetical protein Q7U13_15030 [Rhodoferax sp.]|nr:hypothetical protein [Rhodoferax sp.]
MNHAIRNTRCAAPIQGVARSAAWLLRWLLVLILLADLIGSPLHRHHHDTGIDGSSVHEQHFSLLPAAHHIEEGGHQPSVFHAVTTLRVEWRLSTVDSPPRQGDLKSAVLATAWAVPWLDVEANGSAIWAEPAAPPHKLHRNLPPGSRAPPTRA